MTKYDDEIQLKKDNTKKSWWAPVGAVGIFAGLIWFILGAFIAYQLPESRSNFISIEWETETETDTAGFNVYRAVASEESGCANDNPAETDYVQANDQLIQSMGSATLGARYEYKDTGVERGVDYCYQLEDIEMSGRTTRHDPIVGPRLRIIDRILYMILAPVSLIGGGAAMLGGAYLLYKASR